MKFQFWNKQNLKLITFSSQFQSQFWSLNSHSFKAKLELISCVAEVATPAVF